MEQKESPHASLFLSGKMIQRFEVIQNCLVPRSLSFTETEKQRSQHLVNQVLQAQNKGSKKKLALFILLIDIAALLRHTTLFKQLNTSQQSSLLNIFFDSPMTIFRKGFWGLNTLARLGVYGQKELHDEIGYQLRPINTSALSNNEDKFK